MSDPQQSYPLKTLLGVCLLYAVIIVAARCLCTYFHVGVVSTFCITAAVGVAAFFLASRLAVKYGSPKEGPGGPK
jgi:hypothetical protein